MARRSLEVLRAAIRYWHREYGPLPSVPVVVLPPKCEPRDKWLTRAEADRLIRAAEGVEHLKRFILLGLLTGSRTEAILSLTWDRIDFASGVMRRRAYGEIESRTKRTPPVRLGKRILSLLREWAGNGWRPCEVRHPLGWQKDHKIWQRLETCLQGSSSRCYAAHAAPYSGDLDHAAGRCSDMGSSWPPRHEPRDLAEVRQALARLPETGSGGVRWQDICAIPVPASLEMPKKYGLLA